MDHFRKAVSGIFPGPGELVRQAFGHSANFYSILKDFREDIEFAKQDIRKELPDGLFHLILCRNLAFTYFDEQQQRRVLGEIIGKLVPKGFLITGMHESLPQNKFCLDPYGNIPGIYQKTIA